MKSPGMKPFLLGQLCFYAALVVCVMLKPQGLATNNGISYYGVHMETFLPYALGLLGSAFFSLRAADRLRGPSVQPVHFVLTAYVPLAILIIITPYSAGRYIDWLHTIAGAALFSLQLLLSGWLVWKQKFAIIPMLLTLIELAAGILALLYLAPANGLLLQSQTFFQLAFGSILVYSLPRLKVSTRHRPLAND